MAEGFFVTNKGVELINTAITEESKVEITKAKFGSGGDSSAEWDYDISALKHEEYTKNLDPLTDTYKISDTDPKALFIRTVIPVEQQFTVNEIGYFDSQDNLIIYGTVREEQKKEGVKYQYDNWVKFDNIDNTAVEVVVVSPEFEKVEQLVETTKTEFDQKLQETTTNLTQIIERAESDFDLSNYVSHEEYQELKDMVETSNSIMEDYVG